jgi:hypothetical protein
VFGNQKRDNPKDAFAKVHCSVGETDALMPPVHIGYSRHNVQNEEEVLSATHDNP